MRYITASDALGDWRDSLFSGERPRLYALGHPGFSTLELGPGRLVILGGAPGAGKSALAMQLVVDALRATPDLRAVVCSVEMSVRVLLDRQLSRLAGVPLSVISSRTLTEEHAHRIDAGIATLESVGERLAFVSAPHTLVSVGEAAEEFDAELLLLDYVQRIPANGKHADKRASVNAGLDSIREACHAGCAVLAVAAIGRGKDKAGRSSYANSTLSLASFRESSELEFGADAAYLLAPDGRDSESVLLHCCKNRHAEPADIPLLFARRFQSFTPAASVPSASSGAPSAELAALWGATPAGGGE